MLLLRHSSGQNVFLYRPSVDDVCNTTWTFIHPL